MSEWWTYQISSFVLFSPRTYLRLYELYNDAIWPLQIATLAAAIAALLAARAASPRASRAIPLVLAGVWLFVAWAFHHRRYATINWAAEYFAIGFFVQALLLAWSGATGRLRYDGVLSWRERAAVAIVAFGLFGVPLIEWLAGRDVRQIEAFGTAPDPTAIATLGFLLLARDPPSWSLLAIPLAWCAVNGAFQWTLGLADAIAPPIIALGALALRLTPALRPRTRPSAR
jgi:hypothetical protein